MHIILWDLSDYKVMSQNNRNMTGHFSLSFLIFGITAKQKNLGQPVYLLTF